MQQIPEARQMTLVMLWLANWALFITKKAFKNVIFRPVVSASVCPWQWWLSRMQLKSKAGAFQNFPAFGGSKNLLCFLAAHIVLVFG